MSDSLIDRIRALTFIDPDDVGAIRAKEHAHVKGCHWYKGRPDNLECPGCWARRIRQALDGTAHGIAEGDKVAVEDTAGTRWEGRVTDIRETKSTGAVAVTVYGKQVEES